MFKYSIRPESDVPVYKQLVDQINAEIRSGVLKPGTQLPTMREMAERFQLSCGTVKRVYDRLQEMNVIEMTRRRGTFVKNVHLDRDSRKMQAMNAIDRMIHQLTALSFSPAEINLFVGLKMREWGFKWSGIRISVVTEYMDMANLLKKQLNTIGNATITVWPARQVQEYPYNLDEQSDVILASAKNAMWLGNELPDPAKLVRVAFAMERSSIVALTRIEGRCGVFCGDESTMELLHGCMQQSARREIIQCMKIDDLCANYDCMDYLILPAEMEIADEAQLIVEAFRKKGKLIRFEHAIDEGSMLYLEERIARIREEKRLHPMHADLLAQDGKMDKMLISGRKLP